jgi:hypothetical protein
MKRAAGVALSGLLVLAVLLDPYTLSHDASDFVRPGPAWQIALGLTDVVLLLGVGIFAFRQAWQRAFNVLTCEILLALLAAIVLVQRDGVARFIQGLGAEEYASFYLGSIALRVILLWTIRPA